jgi:hypothetical protein
MKQVQFEGCHLSDRALMMTRQGQSAAVELVDRLARSSSAGNPRPLGRLWRLQLNVAAALVDDPEEVVDRAYLAVERFVSLHRHFVQRLFEAMDDREGSCDTRDLAPVTALITRQNR